MTSTSVTAVIVIVLVSVLLHIVHAQQHQQPTAATTHTVIHNCCDLGFRQSTFSDIVNKPKQYKMKNMCDNHHSTITNVNAHPVEKCSPFNLVIENGGW